MDVRVAGVLLAAGEGSRLGRPKALVEMGGATLAERGVRLLRDGGAVPVVVVTGAADVAPEGAAVVHNPDWRTGMGSSLAVGLRALPGDASAVVIALADQPLVGAAAVRRLIAAHQAGASLAVACYGGRPRNPVLIARQHWPEVIATAAGDTGARGFLREHRDLVTQVECADTGSPDDVDTPADLARVTRAVEAREVGPVTLPPGPTQVVVLNGGSSSGKSTIARELQEMLPRPWLTFGVDSFIEALPPSLADGGALEYLPDGQIVVRDEFRALEAAWIVGVAAMVRAGARIILDEAFLGGGESQGRWRDGLRGLTVLWAGVHCAPGVAAQREAGRADRVPGMADKQADLVHTGVTYDVEVDTTSASAHEAALAIAARVVG